MPAFRNLRRVDSRAFVSNGEMLFDMPRVQDYRFIMIELYGTLTVASNNATSVPADSPCDLIDRVDLVANGKDVLAAAPFVFLVMNNYERNFSQEKTAPGTTQTAHPIRAVGFIDLWNSDGLRPKDSAFRAFLTQLFQLRLTTRDEDSIITKGSATLTLAATVDIYVDSFIEVGRDPQEPVAFKKTTFQKQSFTASNSEYPFELPVGNWIRHVAVRATDDGAPDDDLVNALQLRIDDTDVRAKTNWDALRSVNQFDKAGNAPASGFAVIDSTPEGKLTNGFDARGASRVQLVADVATPGGSGLIEVVTTEFILPN